MAAIVQQSTRSEESAARAFWNAKMQEHPNIAGGFAIAGEVAGFFLNGHALIRFGQWVVRVTGSIAETALLFAVIWITLASVAPGLLELFLSKTLIQFFLWIALASLAIIPEIILPNSLINCAKHWFRAARERHPLFWIVAVLFTLPTLAFLVLTGITIQTLNANGGNLIQTGANLLNIRCFAGWGYGLLEIVYLGVKNSFPREFHIAPAQPVAPSVPTQPIDYEEIARQLLPLVAQEVRQAIPDTTGMVEQLHQLRNDMEALTQQRAQPSETVDETINETEDETNITSFEDAKFHLKQKIDETDMETEEVLTPRITVKLKQERSATKRASSVETKNETNNGRGASRQKALRVIKRNPEINASELAKRAGITPQYAGQILKQQSVN